MDNKELLKIAYNAIEDKKGERIRIIDISKISVIADYFIITNGNNINQVQAISDNVLEEMKKSGAELNQCEGYRSGNWILMDFGGIIVHIFSKDDRFFYDLERVWNDGTIIDIGDL